MTKRSLNSVVESIRKAASREDASDAELMERYFARREDVAFESLVRQHASLVFGVCLRILGNPHDAEDAFQAVFLVLARKGGSITARNRLGNWLYGVAYRTAVHARQLRSRQRARERPMHAGNEVAVAATDDLSELLPYLDEALHRLPEKYRSAVVLCELEGRSRKSAAEQLGIPEGTLSSRLAKARQLLARRLKRHAPLVSAATVATLLAEKSQAAVCARLLEAAAAVPKTPTAEVLALAEKVMQIMLLAKVKKVVLALVAAPLLAWAGAWAVMPVLGWGQTNDAAAQIAEQPKPRDEPPRPEAKPAVTDQERIQGAWRVTSATFDGKSMERQKLTDHRLIVKDKTMIWDIYPDHPPTMADFGLNPAKNPSQISMKGEDAAGVGSSGAAVGIYKLEGDKLWICIADKSKPLPAKFESEVGSEALLCVLERDKKARADQVFAPDGQAAPIQMSAIVPGEPPSLSLVNAAKFRVQCQLKNTAKEAIVVWPYLTVQVLDDQGKPVPVSQNLGRFGLRLDGKSALEGISFVTLEPGAIHTIDISPANYLWDSMAIKGWKLKAAETYTFELRYHYNRADVKKSLGADANDIDNPKQRWNQAVEIDRKMQVKVRVVADGDDQAGKEEKRAVQDPNPNPRARMFDVSGAVSKIDLAKGADKKKRILATIAVRDFAGPLQVTPATEFQIAKGKLVEKGSIEDLNVEDTISVWLVMEPGAPGRRAKVAERIMIFRRGELPQGDPPPIDPVVPPPGRFIVPLQVPPPVIVPLIDPEAPPPLPSGQRK
jgi:RNA polymerase sigma factor (sigma-70 family)